MLVKLYNKTISDETTGQPRLIAGLTCENRAIRFDYNDIDGMQVFGHGGKLSVYQQGIASALKSVYNNNIVLFGAVNHAFDQQIARSAYAKLWDVFMTDEVRIQ